MRRRGRRRRADGVFSEPGADASAAVADGSGGDAARGGGRGRGRGPGGCGWARCGRRPSRVVPARVRPRRSWCGRRLGRRRRTRRERATAAGTRPGRSGRRRGARGGLGEFGAGRVRHPAIAEGDLIAAEGLDVIDCYIRGADGGADGLAGGGGGAVKRKAWPGYARSKAASAWARSAWAMGAPTPRPERPGCVPRCGGRRG